MQREVEMGKNMTPARQKNCPAALVQPDAWLKYLTSDSMIYSIFF